MPHLPFLLPKPFPLWPKSYVFNSENWVPLESHGLGLVYHCFSTSSPISKCRDPWIPGLIWVNPRFVHLDKSTTLEEALSGFGVFGRNGGRWWWFQMFQTSKFRNVDFPYFLDSDLGNLVLKKTRWSFSEALHYSCFRFKDVVATRMPRFSMGGDLMG